MDKKKSAIDFNILIKAVFIVYEFLWTIITPFLRFNKRLAEGYELRIVRQKFPKADLWIQAASVGESHLIYEIMNSFRPKKAISILLTSNTSQGMDVLYKIAVKYHKNYKNIKIKIAYFPFDKPSFMKKAVKQINPKLVIMLETEIWPGLFYILKKQKIRIIIANGRITTKSLNGYKILPFLWTSIAPEKILAVSDDDALKFAVLFKMENIKVMPNIKFDKMEREITQQTKDNPLQHLISPSMKFIVLGSIRKEEEEDVKKIIDTLIANQQNIIIGLFCRHLHRVKNWEKSLKDCSIPVVLRSQISCNLSCKTVIIWDKFGELMDAYKLASTAFVGGSLYPKGGGQNFLEPITCGITPVIGLHWNTFAWVGKEIVTQKLVYEAQNWKEVAEILLQKIVLPINRKNIIKAGYTYIKKHTGGSIMVINECKLI